MKYLLDQIESKLQSFIEGATQVSPWDEYQVQLGRRLVQSLVGAMEEGTSGDLIVPHHYYISLHPNNATFWLGRQDLLNNLANSLQEAAVEQGVQFLLAPVIHITHDPTGGPDRGFDFQEMQREFKSEWELVWMKAYSFLGQRPQGRALGRWSRVEKQLAERFPTDGCQTCAVWRWKGVAQ